MQQKDRANKLRNYSLFPVQVIKKFMNSLATTQSDPGGSLIWSWIYTLFPVNTSMVKPYIYFLNRCPTNTELSC